jgi:hypothetical protein
LTNRRVDWYRQGRNFFIRRFWNLIAPRHIPQGCRHCSAAIIPTLGILRQRLCHDHIQFFRQMRGNAARWWRRRLGVRDDDLRRRAGEGHATGDDFVGDNTERIDIATAIDPPRFGLFRRHILRRTHKDAGARESFAIFIGRQGDTEISEENAAININHNVMRLDIAMYRTLTVGIVKRLAQRIEDADCIAYAQRTALFQDGVQGASADQFHRDIVEPVLLANIVNCDNARMPQAGGGCRLTLEALRKFWVQAELGRKYFDGNRAPEFAIVGAVDPGHATVANLLLDLEMAKPASDKLSQEMAPLLRHVKEA